jgi:hypothetical protein
MHVSHGCGAYFVELSCHRRFSATSGTLMKPNLSISVPPHPQYVDMAASNCSSNSLTNLSQIGSLFVTFEPHKNTFFDWGK